MENPVNNDKSKDLNRKISEYIISILLFILHSDVLLIISTIVLGIFVINVVITMLPSYLFTFPYVNSVCISVYIGGFFVVLVYLLYIHYIRKLFEKDMYESKRQIGIEPKTLGHIFCRGNYFNVPRPNYGFLVTLLGLINYAAVSILFHYTILCNYGTYGDNLFRYAYVMKIAYTGKLTDFFYKNLSGFYAPLYWYIQGKFAAITGVEPYIIVKNISLGLVCIVPPLLFYIWKRCLGNERISFILTLLIMFTLGNVDNLITEPDETLGMLFVIPFYFVYIENVKEREYGPIDYIVGGVIGSLIFLTYFYFFLILPVVFIMGIPGRLKKMIGRLPAVLVIFVQILYFSLWFIIPLFSDIFKYGFESHQNQFISSHMFELPPFVDTDLITAIISVFGMFCIFIFYRRDVIVNFAFRLMLSVWIIYLVGFILLPEGIAIMPNKFGVFAVYALIIASAAIVGDKNLTGKVIKLFESIFSSDEKRGNNHINKASPIKTGHHYMYNFLLLSVFIAFIINYNGVYSITTTDSYKIAVEQNIPYEQLRIFSILPYKNRVFLTTHEEVLPYLPIYLFLPQNIHYSHPAARHMERLAFLSACQFINNSEDLYHAFTENEFDRIDFIYLPRYNSTHFIFRTTYIEDFKLKYVNLYFKAELFENSSYFEKIVIDEAEIFRVL